MLHERLQLLGVEARGAAVHAVEVEAGHELRNAEEFLPVGGRPPEQRKVVHHGLGREAVVEVVGHHGAAVALAHLGAVLVEDERDVGVAGRFDAEGAEERNVLGGVAQMILAADDVGHAHFEVVHHVDEVEHGLAVAPPEDPVGVLFLPVGERPDDVADDEVGNRDRLAGHAEIQGAVAFVGETLVP